MQSTPNLESLISSLPEDVTKFAYEKLQQGKGLFGLVHKRISFNLLKTFAPQKESKGKPLSRDTLLELENKRSKLVEADWQDAHKGVYPASILFDNAWEDLFRYYPELLIDMPQMWERIRNKEFQKFSFEVDWQNYPSYYLQNFHYQTDGYLSDKSANLYDLQVELLFNGSADGMRRRILAPLKAGLDKNTPQEQIKVLDVACGTGRTLKFIRATLPEASLYGVDLSTAYLCKANQLLSEIPGELPQLARANGEELPYLDDYFHGLTSVFLFHELPPQARQQVINEAFRVTKPGGIFVICDSLQVGDIPKLETMMDNFSVQYHEPYYRSYINDNLVDRLEKAGFENIETQNHFVSKYWIARKLKAN